MGKGGAPSGGDVKGESTAPEYRQDPVTGAWIIVAPERGLRPISRRREGWEEGTGLSLPSQECPFCEGAEAHTPPEILAIRSEGPANGPGWRVRVVPNRYPAVRPRDEGAGRAPSGDSAWRAMPGHGHHELVIECPQHDWTISGLSDEHVGQVFEVYRERLRTLRQLGFAYALVFKNAGADAGATQEHAHSQILATACLPSWIAQELAGCERHRQSSGGCVFCELIERERSAGVRIIAETTHFIAWCPYASRFSHEAWIIPRRHAASYEACQEIEELGALVRELLGRLERMLVPAAYNYYLHTAPFEAAPESYHWHLEIVPRSTGLAGFELGAGMYINPVLPEVAARSWRETRAAEHP